MDYSTDLNNLTGASNAQESASAQELGVKAGIDAAIAIINAGYQADQAAIASQVAAQVGQIETENATLTGQVTDLQGQVATLQASVTGMTATLANLGYNPDGTAIQPDAQP